MSDNISKRFAEKVLKSDSEILKKLEAAHGEPEEIYKILKERLDLYREAERFPISDMYRLFFNNIRSDILIEAAVVATKKQFADQISQIVSRLDAIESDVKTIKDKLKIN